MRGRRDEQSGMSKGQFWRWTWRGLLGSFVLGLVLMVLLAKHHAHSMIHFATEDRSPTPSIETLSPGQKLRVLWGGVVCAKPQNHKTPSDLGLDCETVHFAGSQGHELEAWYLPAAGTSQGSNLVLLFHGYGASKAALLDYAARFHAWNWNVLLVDFFGSGGSSGNFTSFGYLEAEDVCASHGWAIEHLPESRREIILLYGLSMGGAAVTRACGELGLQPDAIVIESTFPHFRETIAQRFRLMNLPAFPAADLLLFWGGWELGIHPRSHNPEAYVAGITSPALVLTGELDKRVPEASVRRMVRNFAGRAELRVYAAGHRPFVTADPERWRQDLSKFLSSL